jgi:hypothetical protein
VVVTYGQRGPGGEGVAEEGLDAVAAWCSEIEEGDGVRGDPVRLLPHEWLRLGVGRRRRAPTDGQPRLLLLLHSSYVNISGLGNPNWLGFEPGAAVVLIKVVVGGMNDAIDYSTRGGHSRWLTWLHGLPFPRLRPRVRAEE